MSHEKIIVEHYSEKSTPKITGVIRDTGGIALPGSLINTLTLTLYDELTDSLLGGRSAQQNILGINGGSVGEDGLLSLQLTASDMTIQTPSRVREVHVALIEWVYNTVLGNKLNIKFTVANLNKVT